MSGACDGLRVVDFSTWMAGPLASMVLADNGADVTKIEPPGGDPARAIPAFQTWNRGKKSIVLDLTSRNDRERALSLLADADVAVVSYRLGVAERLGVGYEDVRAINPRCVYVAISGYGEGGAKAGLAGYEALVSAKSGRMAGFERIADRDGPMYPAVPCASFAAAMFAVQGALAALHRRRETGAGQDAALDVEACKWRSVGRWAIPVDGDERSGREHVDVIGEASGVRASRRHDVHGTVVHRLLGGCIAFHRQCR